MSEEIDPLVIQRTQQKLGKYIQRPQLTDKLLKRPPFRFIHDIITASINQYGVLDHVFTKQELVSDNIKEKEEKISFLKKFIAHLSSELGQDFNAKPSKIVAGLEVDRTNDLLQALALLLENKHNTKQQSHNTSNGNLSKNGGSDTPTKTGKTSNGNSKQSSQKSTGISSSKEPAPPPTSKTATKTETINKQAKTKDVAKAAVTRHVPSTKPAPVMSSRTATQSQETKIKDHDNPTNKKGDNKTTRQNPHNGLTSVKMSSSRQQKNTKLEGHPPDEVITDDSPVDIPMDLSHFSEDPIKETTNRSEARSLGDGSQISPDFPSVDSGITVEIADTKTSNSKPLRPLKPSAVPHLLDEGLGVEEDVEKSDVMLNSSAQLSPPSSSKLNAFEKPLSDRNSTTNVPLKRPPSGSRPKSSRRPPSRTIRDRLSVIPQETRPLSSQVPKVIIDGNPMSDDEEDRIVQGAVFNQITGDLSDGLTDENVVGEQGKLVEQILSAQKEWDPLANTEPSTMDSTSSSAQVQHLKTMIQEMAQVALPLGQLIPLIHEDMETVQQDWQFWKKEADSLEEEYHREKSLTQSGLEKLQTELEQLNQAVIEYQMKLNMAKASVLKTENDVSLVISNFGKKR